MSVSVFAHPFLGALLGDKEVAACFSAEADIAAMLRFEAALAQAEAEAGVIPAAAAEAIVAAISRMRIAPSDLAGAVARDGVVVPELVRLLRAAVGEPHAGLAHKGSTSQDVIDTSLFLRLKAAADILDARLGALMAAFDRLEAEAGTHMLCGHTRMQRARPVSLAHKIAGWRDPLARHRARLPEVATNLFRVQLGGAVGNRAELGAAAQAVADGLADRLGLLRAPRATHAERDGVVAFGHWCTLVCGTLGKFGADICLMAQNEVGEVTIAGGGGSSAMPEKNNPVAAEILVTLARFAAAQQGGLDQALVHENERSGAAWTLEWMILPQLVVAAGAATRTALALVTALRFPAAADQNGSPT
ncbi:3-carboxy-cis,cis-muconate cycloisomerase [Xanthobacter autotrophicus]|uniref:3-carboxy-cis,cis-muconate cycloisomerase n=1 Tax=Xanthobacter autotrophicus TaxID=280 RepID=UPI003727AABF